MLLFKKRFHYKSGVLQVLQRSQPPSRSLLRLQLFKLLINSPRNIISARRNSSWIVWIVKDNGVLERGHVVDRGDVESEAYSSWVGLPPGDA